MSPDSPQPAVGPPHPLALELIDALRARPHARVLEVGRGSGRNTRALQAAGFAVVDLADAQPSAAALSTHALLHGTRNEVASLLARIAARLEPGAPLYATFGSVRDARYGEGTPIEPDVFAPLDGDEAGVAHLFLDDAALRALLTPLFAIDRIDEVDVDEIAGTWAHEQRPLKAAVHWFVRARNRQ